jgi:hypothetical protein
MMYLLFEHLTLIQSRQVLKSVGRECLYDVSIFLKLWLPELPFCKWWVCIIFNNLEKKRKKINSYYMYWTIIFILLWGSSWSWSFGSWIYNYLCNQCNKVVSFNPAQGEMHSIQHYVIKFVSDLRQVSGFVGVFRFTPPTKLTAMI